MNIAIKRFLSVKGEASNVSKRNDTKKNRKSFRICRENVRIWHVKLLVNGQKKYQETLEDIIQTDSTKTVLWDGSWIKVDLQSIMLQNTLITMAILPSRLLQSWS
jgi:hypothetical protein